jgi:hypothetical protein
MPELRLRSERGHVIRRVRGDSAVVESALETGVVGARTYGKERPDDVDEARGECLFYVVVWGCERVVEWVCARRIPLSTASRLRRGRTYLRASKGAMWGNRVGRWSAM